MPCEIQSVRSQIKDPVLPRAQQFQESGTWVMHINSTLQKQRAGFRLKPRSVTAALLIYFCIRSLKCISPPCIREIQQTLMQAHRELVPPRLWTTLLLILQVSDLNKPLQQVCWYFSEWWDQVMDKTDPRTEYHRDLHLHSHLII